MKLKTLTLIAALACCTVYAQDIEVKDAWVRATVPGQKATGAFMKITAKDGARLLYVSSSAAGVTELHEMKLQGDVMSMRAVVDGLDIPAGKTVELKPGGYHVMLMDLKVTLDKDRTLPLTLVFKDLKGAERKVELKVPVAAQSSATGTTPHQH